MYLLVTCAKSLLLVESLAFPPNRQQLWVVAVVYALFVVPTLSPMNTKTIMQAQVIIDAIDPHRVQLQARAANCHELSVGLLELQTLQ
jgi:hypothetical protein